MPTWLLSKTFWKIVGPTLGAAALFGALHVHVQVERHAREAAHAAGIAEGKVAERDSMISVAAHQRDSVAGVRAEETKAVVRATAATDVGFRHVSSVAAAANAATRALEDSLRALSATAKADTTVQAVERASEAVSATVAQLQDSIGALGLRLEAERIAKAAQHATDSTALVVVSVVAAGNQRALEHERQQPKRTAKSNGLLVMSGAIATGAVWTLHHLVTR